jgi:beta-mannosidase
MDATVPGDVHLDCRRAGLIPDPFVGTNSDHCVWMEDKDWWYRLDFVSPARPAGQRALLVFEGLDTFATVFLNGQEAGSHRNMFTPLRMDVSDALAQGVNRLAVCLASPRFAVRRTDDARVAGLPPRDRLFARKAQSCYGWDIAPRLVTCGIWREAYLLLADAMEIERVNFRTLRLTERTAEVELSAEIVRHGSACDPVTAEFRLGGRIVTTPVAGESASARLTIDAPRLWWPHNHGVPFLYDYAVELRAGGRTLDVRQGRVGVRTVELEQKPLDGGGSSFCFLVNGKRVFLKGMNWTPADAIYSRVGRDRYRQLAAAAADANINALRVWGGGVYEDDAFYEFCDEFGILVWQDFMFACGCYPQDEGFLAEVRAEAEHVVGRLRSHPCLLTWCGDNENDWQSWVHGVPDYRFNRLSKHLLPAVVRELSPDLPYVPSSPFSPTLEDQNSDQEGDVHLWHHGHAFASDRYLGRKPRMVTEIGHLALPDMATVRSFIPAEDLWPIWNDAWRMHSADPLRRCGNDRLATMFRSIQAQGWAEPATLEELIAMTQQLQAEATDTWIRHFGNLPECWGIFLWNLADCWPQVSDAYIAYPFQPKPALEAVKRAYAQIER